MTDHFAALHQPRRPWLDADSLKETFHTLSAEAHPDRVHNQDLPTRERADARYVELNSAYQCLRNHKSRLAHLLWLETGAKPGDSRTLPEDVVQLFGTVGALLRETNPLVAEKSQATSAMAKVGLMQKALPHIEKLAQLQAVIQTQLQGVTDELRKLDGDWDNFLGDPTKRAAAFGTVEKLYHLFGFYERWAGQLQERSFQLTV